MSSTPNFPRLGTTGDGERDFGPFVASANGRKFHRPDCEWAQYISPRNLETYSSHEEAVQSGKKPCGTCRA
jgi:methylphosphotriester-DNA--protein-cysteine methyltransferase